MQNPAKIGKITGPPGCGKSTELLRLIERACEKYFPNKIGAVSFTNAAVETIRERVAQTVGETKDVVKNVRTIHSHCFRLLGLSGDEIAESHLSEFNKKNPAYALKNKNSDEDDTTWDSANRYSDYLFNQSQILRNQLIPEDQWPPDVLSIHKVWKKWMKEEKLKRLCLQKGSII